MEDAEKIKEAVEHSDRILVLGAGFLGSEIAASLRHRETHVLMADVAAAPMEAALGPELGQIYARLHREHGADLRLRNRSREWRVEGKRLVAVSLDGGRYEDIDAVIVAVGVTPNVEVGRRLGLSIADNGIQVDETLQACPGVYAVGDIAAHFHPLYGRRIRAEHWQVAQRQGDAVAASIVHGPSSYTQLPWFWSDQYDWNLQYLGSRADSDRVLWRGRPEGEKFSVFQMKDDVIRAAISVNDGITGRILRPLLSEARPVDDDALADVNVDLRALVRSRS